MISALLRKGLALPTVLGLVAFLVTIGLALGTVSTLSLNLSKGQHLDRQLELLARSGLAEFLAQAHRQSQEFDLFEGELTLPQGQKLIERDDGQSWCDFTLDPSQPGYSTDNTSSDTFRPGWSDQASSGRSVPPFSLALILRSHHHGAERYYRAILRRTWPYAVYCQSGPMILLGNPSVTPPRTFEAATAVQGDLFTSWGGSDGPPPPDRRLDTPRKILAAIEDQAGWYPDRRGSEIQIGPSMLYQPVPEAQPLPGFPDFFVHSAENLPQDGVLPVYGTRLTDQGNLVEGDIHYVHSQGLDLRLGLGPPVDGAPPNRFEGELIQRSGLAVDPLKGLEAPDTSDFAPAQPHLIEKSLSEALGVNDSGLPAGLRTLEPPELLAETLDLTAGSSPHYYHPGHLTNRAAYLFEEDWPQSSGLQEPLIKAGSLVVHETQAGLKLQDCVLVVEGDLDLGASNRASPVEVFGNNATLVVKGKLTLSGARIDAGDQGFVLFAHDIVLKAGGHYKGLIVARRELSLVPEGEPLRVQGGLMSGLGVTLRSVNLDYDPGFLKMVNGAGDFEVVSWEMAKKPPG